jgi:hypothetical protein
MPVVRWQVQIETDRHAEENFRAWTETFLRSAHPPQGRKISVKSCTCGIRIASLKDFGVCRRLSVDSGEPLKGPNKSRAYRLLITRTMP